MTCAGPAARGSRGEAMTVTFLDLRPEQHPTLFPLRYAGVYVTDGAGSWAVLS